MKKINKFSVLKVFYFIIVGIALPHAFLFADTQKIFAADIFLAFSASLVILILDCVERQEKKQL